MSRTRRGLLAGTWGLLLLTGCAQGPWVHTAGLGSRPGDVPVETILPVVARGALVPDLDRLAPFAALEGALAADRAGGETYRALDAKTCQCLAARNSGIANLLDLKAASCLDDCEPPRRGSREVERSSLVLRGVLMDSALEAREQSAGGALELFYRLAEAEAKRDLLRRSLAGLDEAIAEGKRLRAEGFSKPGDDFDALDRQRLAVLNDQVEATLAIEQINSQLRPMLALGPNDGTRWRIWPEADGTVLDDEIEPSSAVAVGMASRAELQVLDRLLAALDAETAPAVRTALGAANVLLGADGQGPPSGLKAVLVLLCKVPLTSDEQVASLARQLRAARDDRARAIASEIEQAALTVQARLKAVAIAREAIVGWRKRIDELKAREERGISTFPDATTARLKELSAQGDLIGKVTAWQIARVKLFQAQGRLARDCGFGGYGD